MAELKIPVKVDIDEIDKLIDELKHLQTYKLYEGADQKLVDLDEVVKIFAGHVKAGVEQSIIESERNKGKWIYKNDLKQFFCSECGYPSLTYDDTYIYGMDLPNYCEDCGADMRGEEDD